MLMAAPFAACVALTGIHCYLGIHVIMRGVIFVDLALAQVAALGAAVGMMMGAEPGSLGAYAGALGFTLAGAGVLAVTRVDEQEVPQEAVIGIVYAVASAIALLLLSKSAMDRDEIEHMLTGHLLVVDWVDVGVAAGVYTGVGVIHALCRRPFLALSRTKDHRDVPRARWWDFLFYATFGVVVTSSVHLAGVLLVFCYLIVPAASAALFVKSMSSRLILGWSLGLVASAAGLLLSVQADLPTGPSVVAAFGGVFLLAGVTRALTQRRPTHHRPASGE